MQSCLNKTNILLENCNILAPVVYIEDCKEDPRVESGLEAKLAVINDEVDAVYTTLSKGCNGVGIKVASAESNIDFRADELIHPA